MNESLAMLQHEFNLTRALEWEEKNANVIPIYAFVIHIFLIEPQYKIFVRMRMKLS